MEPTKVELSFVNEGTEPIQVNVRDLLSHDRVIIPQGALDVIKSFLSSAAEQ